MNKSHIMPRLLLAAYAAVMLWLLFGQRIGGNLWGDYSARLAENFNLIPFATVAEFWTALHSPANGHAVINLAGNVVMFVPLGFLLPLNFPRLRPFGRCMAAAAAILAAVELVQLFTLLGVCDVDDLILNLLGTAAGYGCWRLLRGLRLR